MTTEVDEETTADALARAASLGMFFSYADPDDGRAWRPSSDLHDPDTVDGIVRAVADGLGCEARVGASLVYQGVASRLLSPQIGAFVAAGVVPHVTSDSLRWVRPGDEMLRLAWRGGRGFGGDPATTLRTAIATAFREHLDPLAAALTRTHGLAAGLLRGNATAVVVSGLRLAAPLSDVDWRGLADIAMTTGELADGGEWAAPGRFRRRSCCLYYRVPGGGLCGDCPLPRR